MTSQRGSASAPALRTPYLRVLGLELDTSLATSPGSRGFTAEEEEEFGEISRSEGLYEKFCRSVAPSIFGNLGQSPPSLLRYLERCEAYH